MLSFNTNGDFKDNYKYLIGSILPRPIAWVSTVNRDGSFNLAPFSFFTAVSAKPMIIAFCPLIRTSTGEKKDTLVNIERTREFVVNFVSRELADKCNLTSSELKYGEDEFKYASLTTLASEQIAAPRVKESKIHFECILRDIISYGDQPGQGSLVTGEVVRVHIDDSLMVNGKISTDRLDPVGRGAGNDWFGTNDKFELERLMQAQIQK
jgi:flavin reductase (DIM6/NTAB) family NADH-FMN oxidoreductase RutF